MNAPCTKLRHCLRHRLKMARLLKELGLPRMRHAEVRDALRLRTAIRQAALSPATEETNEPMKTPAMKTATTYAALRSELRNQLRFTRLVRAMRNLPDVRRCAHEKACEIRADLNAARPLLAAAAVILCAGLFSSCAPTGGANPLDREEDLIAVAGPQPSTVAAGPLHSPCKPPVGPPRLLGPLFPGHSPLTPGAPLPGIPTAH